MNPNPRRSCGFTLIELMIAMAIAAVLMTLAAPNFQQAVNGNRLSGAASEVIGALQLARSEAIRANRRAVLCRSANADVATATCDTTNAAWPGWIVFVDTDGNGNRNGTEAVIKAATIDASLQLLGSASVVTLAHTITFRGDGTARTAAGGLLNGSLAICMPTTRPAENVRHVSLAFGSRTAARRTNAGGSCAAPSDT